MSCSVKVMYHADRFIGINNGNLHQHARFSSITCSGGSREQCCKAHNRICLKSHYSRSCHTDTGQPVATKADHSDYIGGISTEANVHNASFGGFFPVHTQLYIPNMFNLNGIFFFFISFFGSSIGVQPRPVNGIFGGIYQKIRSGARWCLLGVRKVKKIIYPKF